jgi:hypothetical protein
VYCNYVTVPNVGGFKKWLQNSGEIMSLNEGNKLKEQPDNMEVVDNIKLAEVLNNVEVVDNVKKGFWNLFK